MDLSGKIAVVTGASSGIGEATAIALANAGMTVVATARRAERLDAIARANTGVVAHPADVTAQRDVESLAERVTKEFGACHVLVNNAGASFEKRFRGIDDLDMVRAAMELNFLGTVRPMAVFAPLLLSSAPARVINVASVAGKLGIGAPAYTASKFATVGFTEAVALDWRGRGVTVTQLNPGFIATEGFPQDDLMRSRFTRRLVGQPADVADAVVDAARCGPRERTVPRWYRSLVVARHCTAPLFWFAAAKAAGFRR